MGPANQQPENTGAQRVCWSGLGEGQGGQTGSSSSHLLWGGCSNCNGQSANWEGGFIGWQSLLVASGIAQGEPAAGTSLAAVCGAAHRAGAAGCLLLRRVGTTAAGRSAWPAGQQPQAAEACAEARASGPSGFCQGASAGASGPGALALGGSAVPLCAVCFHRPAVLVQHGGLLAHAAAHAVHALSPRLAQRRGRATALTGQLEQQPGAGLDLCRQGGEGAGAVQFRFGRRWGQERFSQGSAGIGGSTQRQWQQPAQHNKQNNKNVLTRLHIQAYPPVQALEQVRLQGRDGWTPAAAASSAVTVHAAQGRGGGRTAGARQSGSAVLAVVDAVAALARAVVWQRRHRT